MTKTNFAEGILSLTSCSCPSCVAPRVLLRQPWPLRGCSVPQRSGCFPQGDGGFGGQGWSVVTSGLPGCPLPTTAAHIPLPPWSKEWINNQEMRQKWGPGGSWHLNVTRRTWCRRVKVSFCPCVYRCLHIDLFPDTWAMTWKEFRLQQILHHASIWPLGLNKGKSITLLPWRPWHSRDEERWCRRPRTGWWHRRRSRMWGHPEGHSACAPCLARAQRGCLSELAAPGRWGSRRHRVLSQGLAKLVLNLFLGESGSCSKREKGVLRLSWYRRCESRCLAV